MPAAPLPPDLPERPAPEGARLVARWYLDQAAEALQRLDDPAALEALHDFRVAVRRLRSTLRAYRPLVEESVTRKLRRRLRDLADRTNAGRDAEVQLAWLREQQDRRTLREATGLQWLIERLETRRQAEYDGMVDALRRDFPRVERRLRGRLGEYRARLTAPGEPGTERFGAAAAAALGAMGQEFVERLAAVEAAEDAAAAHAARIAAKRVRYVLEPLAEQCPGGPSLVRRLKSLQDLLGEVNDAHVLEGEVAAAASATGATRALRLFEVALADGPDAARRASRSGRDPRPGLLAIARLLRERRTALLARLEEEWLADEVRGFAAELSAAAGALAGQRGARKPPRRRGRGAAARRDGGG